MMQSVLSSFSRLCVSNSRVAQSLATKLPTSLVSTIEPQHQQIRCINTKGYLTERGWKAIGYKWIVKFPEEYTLKKLPLMKLAGRDPTTGKINFNSFKANKTINSCFCILGRRVIGGVGGGHKKKFRWIDNKRHGPKEGPPLVEKVLNIQYDTCHPARIALVASGDKVRYITATSTMKPGDLISTSGHISRIASKLLPFFADMAIPYIVIILWIPNYLTLVIYFL